MPRPTSPPQPTRAFLCGLGGVLLFAALFGSTSCATHCRPERCTPPPREKFTSTTLTTSRERYHTWQTRSPGTPILLLHAVNGISPSVLHFSQELEDWGYRVYIPNLYPDWVDAKASYGYDGSIESLGKLKRDDRWLLQDPENAGPILREIESLASEVSRREGNRDIAVIGNCLTGSLPIALLDEPHVRLVALAQPALPLMRAHQVILRLPQSRSKRKGLGVPDCLIRTGLEGLRKYPDKRIIGFHYRHDPIAPIVKFDALHEKLASAGLEDRFTAYVLTRPSQGYTQKRPEWTVGEVTTETRKMLTPHSTLINPESLEDRAWFRARLREELDRTF